MLRKSLPRASVALPRGGHLALSRKIGRRAAQKALDRAHDLRRDAATVNDPGFKLSHASDDLDLLHAMADEIDKQAEAFTAAAVLLDGGEAEDCGRLTDRALAAHANAEAIRLAVPDFDMVDVHETADRLREAGKALADDRAAMLDRLDKAESTLLEAVGVMCARDDADPREILGVCDAPADWNMTEPEQPPRTGKGILVTMSAPFFEKESGMWVEKPILHDRNPPRTNVADHLRERAKQYLGRTRDDLRREQETKEAAERERFASQAREAWNDAR